MEDGEWKECESREQTSKKNINPSVLLTSSSHTYSSPDTPLNLEMMPLGI